MNTDIDYSLIAYHNQKAVFHSESRWLYPIFELVKFLKENNMKSTEISVKDKIAGAAAAYLFVYLSVCKCRIHILSKKGKSILDKYHIPYTYDQLIERVDCKTEDIIHEHMKPEEAFHYLLNRAGLIEGKSLVIRNLVVYREETLVINHLNLNVEAGKQLIIHGDNGSGKTSLLKAILGLIPHQKGSIRIDNLDQTKYYNKNFNRLIGYIPQEEQFSDLPVSVKEVVEMGIAGQKLKKSEKELRVEVAMRRTGCYHLQEQKFQTLSGGEKKRGAIARVLCQQAKILLLDEPNSFLDRAMQQELIELLKQIVYSEGMTIILVTHDDKWINNFNWQTKELIKGKLE